MRGLLLPVELRHVNHASEHQLLRFYRHAHAAYNVASALTIAMATPAPIDQLADRVERLLLRYQELQRAHMLLGDEMRALTRERDQLRSRLHSARTRVDALLQHLPQTSAHDPQAASPDTTA